MAVDSQDEEMIICKSKNDIYDSSLFCLNPLNSRINSENKETRTIGIGPSSYYQYKKLISIQ